MKFQSRFLSALVHAGNAVDRIIAEQQQASEAERELDNATGIGSGFS
jgi:hypothetical protein